jgi:hypothetical protein
MRVPVWLALAAWPGWAHMMSMSSGDLTVDGARAHYELRMPLYEMAHVADPAHGLLDRIRFSSGGREAQRVAQSCQTNQADGVYVCTADYDFGAPVEQVDVECTLHAVTVPNHVHLLRAEMAGKRDQAVFDLSFTRATLRFRPPTPMETTATESGAGFIRALGGMVQLLFLAVLVLAARSRGELLALAAMFLAGQIISALAMPHTGWQPAARFVEAAAALTVAYLAVEILLLPKAGARWLVAGVLGAFHGLYFHLFLQTTGYRPGFVLAGAAAAEVMAIAIFALVFSRLKRMARALHPVEVSASALLAFGMVWFVLRLRN